MVPAGEITRQTIEALGDLLDEGDVVVDGGNSRYTDDRTHAAMLGERGIGFVDAGVSGGVWGLDNGYALMVGGDAENVAQGPADLRRAASPRASPASCTPAPVGAGHFAKMVHNGIEYGLMQAYAEGYELLEAADVVDDVPGRHQVLDAGHGDPVLAARPAGAGARGGPELAEIRGYVDDSGEGRWTVEEAINHAVPVPVITAALFARFASRQDDSPAMKAVAALRNQFGGHAVTKVAKGEVEKPA